jgi:hypothetical protein
MKGGQTMWRLWELCAVLWDGVKEGWQAGDFGGRLRAWWEVVRGVV